MTATDQITTDDLDAMEARANAATEGPWEVVQRTVDAMIEGDDECQYCADRIPLVSSEDFEGGDGLLAYTLHKHEAEPHHVAAGGNEITGAVDWEEGGILRGVDVVFIAHARTEHPALIAAVRKRDEDLAEFEGLCNRQAAILTRAANALKGNPGPLSAHSHHDVGELAEVLAAEVRGLRTQLRDAQDDAWKRGYDACRAGEQRHSPYRAMKPAPGGAPKVSPRQMNAKDARNWAYNNLPLYTYEELVNVSDEDMKLIIEASHIDHP